MSSHLRGGESQEMGCQSRCGHCSGVRGAGDELRWGLNMSIGHDQVGRSLGRAGLEGETWPLGGDARTVNRAALEKEKGGGWHRDWA